MSPRPSIRFAATLMMLGWLAAPPAWSHEGEDHGAPQPVTSDPSLVVRSASNDAYEVVLKYRSLPGERSTAARVYLSEYTTNVPIQQAVVTLRTTSPRQVTATTRETSPGVYEAALSYEQAGRYTLILAIGSSPATEFAFQDLPMGEDLVATHARAPAGRAFGWWMGAALVALLLTVALIVRRRSLRAISRTALVLIASAAAMLLPGREPRAEGGQANPAQPGATASVGESQPRYMPKESQFFQNVRTIVAGIESLRGRINAVGHVVPESGALASVEAPRDGKLEGAGRRLAVGDRVRQGQLIANLLVIDRLPIRAPISGLVAEVHFTNGQWVQAGAPLVVILDERHVRVELPLFGENLNRALRTRDGTITTSALPGLRFPARVRGLAPTASEPDRASDGAPTAGGSIPPLLLTVVNHGGLLRPGMLVEASLELPTAEQLIAVPESAVIYQESGAVVFVHTGPEVFEQRSVHVVGRYVDRLGLSGMVRSGERIVVSGAQALVSAPPVTTAAPARPAKGSR